jgi:hypothetical protein
VTAFCWHRSANFGRSHRSQIPILFFLRHDCRRISPAQNSRHSSECTRLTDGGCFLSFSSDGAEIEVARPKAIRTPARAACPGGARLRGTWRRSSCGGMSGEGGGCFGVGFCPIWVGLAHAPGFHGGEPKDQSEQFRPAILLDLSDYDARDASILSFRFSELSQPSEVFSS